MKMVQSDDFGFQVACTLSTRSCYNSLVHLVLGMSQLLSQGTADILMDSCTEFWDGTDICPLSEPVR